MVLAVTTLGTILYSIIVFLLIILIAGRYPSVCQGQVNPKGNVKLNINDREIIVSPGSNLLTTLSGNSIFLPSACGGGGTCGMCKCQMMEGGGSICPTETGFFTRKEQHNHWRLGCQVKVRETLTIKVPEAVMGIKKWEMRGCLQQECCNFY